MICSLRKTKKMLGHAKIALLSLIVYANLISSESGVEEVSLCLTREEIRESEELFNESEFEWARNMQFKFITIQEKEILESFALNGFFKKIPEEIQKIISLKLDAFLERCKRERIKELKQAGCKDIVLKSNIELCKAIPIVFGVLHQVFWGERYNTLLLMKYEKYVLAFSKKPQTQKNCVIM